MVYAASIFLMSCERKPFVEHKLKFEKVSDDCKEQQSYFRMNSNFGGSGMSLKNVCLLILIKNNLVRMRQGDTVVVSFKTAAGNPANKVYHITLDIDSYPHIIS